VSVPFKEFLVNPEAGLKEKADYIEKISCPPDWEIIFDPPLPSSDQPTPDSDLSPPEDESSTYSLLTEFERFRCSSNVEKKLDYTQLEAVKLAFENKLTLIQVCIHSARVFLTLQDMHVSFEISIFVGQYIMPLQWDIIVGFLYICHTFLLFSFHLIYHAKFSNYAKFL